MTAPVARTVAIVGFGYMGGSMALDLLAQGVRVRAYDTDAALSGLNEFEHFREVEISPSLAHAALAELVVLAAPIQVNLELLHRIVPDLVNARLVIDIGSTKRAIVAAAESLGIGERFVGCHPLCGSTLSGWRNSQTSVFRDQRVYFCPTAKSEESTVGIAMAFWQCLDAIVEHISADEHDRLLAWTSHLPQAVSTLLGVTLGTHGIGRAKLGPGGKKMTELAQSSSRVWSPILMDNMEGVSEALGVFAERVEYMRKTLRVRNEREIRRLFDEASEWVASPEQGDSAGSW